MTKQINDLLPSNPKLVPTEVVRDRAVRNNGDLVYGYDDDGDPIYEGKTPLREKGPVVEDIMTDVEDRYVVVHPSIVNKAVELGIDEVPFTKFVDEPQVANIGKAQFSMYVEYVKMVRKEKWPEPLRKKASVTVTKPNI